MRTLFAGVFLFFFSPSFCFSVTLSENNYCVKAEMEYPVFGQSFLDQSVHNWAESYFKKAVDGFKKTCAEDNEAGVRVRPSEMFGKSGVTTTQGAIFINFSFYSYTKGAAHPSHLYETLLFDKEGKELGLADLFAKPQGLWEFLSEYAQVALRSELGNIWLPESTWLSNGLAPKAESFKNFEAITHGLRLIFPEYQVAPYALGAQTCEIPLADLARFAPKPEIWGQPKTVSPSFDCAKAATPVEAAICAEPILAQYDVDMAAEYKRAQTVANKETLIAEQRQWLKQRQSQCADASFKCLLPLYKTRLRQLQQFQQY